jgi:hypothetical protein
MGGKGGGGGNYYNPPPDTSGNSTLEEATKTLANTAPLDMSGMQQNINVKKAAADATAKPADTVKAADDKVGEAVSGTETTKDSSELMKQAVLTPPGFWADYGKAAPIDPNAQV